MWLYSTSYGRYTCVENETQLTLVVKPMSRPSTTNVFIVLGSQTRTCAWYNNHQSIVPVIRRIRSIIHRDSGTSVGHRTCDSRVAGSTPGRAPPRSGLGQATCTCVPLSPSCKINVYSYSRQVVSQHCLGAAVFSGRWHSPLSPPLTLSTGKWPPNQAKRSGERCKLS